MSYNNLLEKVAFFVIPVMFKIYQCLERALDLELFQRGIFGNGIR
jgi:hypothetical protein